LVATDTHALVIADDGDGRGRLAAYRLENGHADWSNPGPGWRRVVPAGELVIGLVDSRLVALDSSTGLRRWEADAGDAAGTVSVAGGWVVAAGDRELLAVARDTGFAVWRKPLQGVSTRALVIGDFIVVGLGDGTLMGLGIVDGAERWRMRLGSPVINITAQDQWVYAALANGSICAVRLLASRHRWCQQQGVPIAGTPLVDGDLLHVALFDNSVRTYDRNSGARVGQVGLGQRPVSGPERAGTSIVVPLTTGAWARFAASSAERIGPAESPTAHLHRASVSSASAVLLGLAIPPGGRLQLTALKLSSAASAPASPEPNR
jgi:hypothetical protein